MRIIPATNLACPIDGLPLQTHAHGRRCANNHSFDIAREGYCNLLLVQHKASLDPGDSKTMVAARHRFLEGYHFVPIADFLCKSVIDCLAAKPGNATYNIVDAGCGEGYYLDRLVRQLPAQSTTPTSVSLTGIDVSKWAIRQAARRTSPVTWLVANNRHPPFLAGSVDVIACLFGFPVWEGFRSVQVPGQHVLLVDPGPDHLLELREIIYPTVMRQPSPSLAASLAAGYRLQREHNLRFVVSLTSAQMVQDLLAMTPHAYRLTDIGRNALAALSNLTVTVDVTFRLLILRP